MLWQFFEEKADCLSIVVHMSPASSIYSICNLLIQTLQIFSRASCAADRRCCSVSRARSRGPGGGRDPAAGGQLSPSILPIQQQHSPTSSISKCTYSQAYLLYRAWYRQYHFKPGRSREQTPLQPAKRRGVSQPVRRLRNTFVRADSISSTRAALPVHSWSQQLFRRSLNVQLLL